MKKLIGIIIYLIGFSCCENKFVPDYPAIIERNNLQDLYDKAKWEIYKLNTLVEQDDQTDYLVSFSDTSFYEFLDAQYEYGLRNKGEALSKNKDEVIKNLGEENVMEFLEVELEFSELDSSIMFQNDEIWFEFHLKEKHGKYWQKPNQGFYQGILFKAGKIVKGRELYPGQITDFGYPIELQKSSDIKFLKLIAKKKNLNDWLTWYKNDKYKSQLN